MVLLVVVHEIVFSMDRLVLVVTSLRSAYQSVVVARIWWFVLVVRRILVVDVSVQACWVVEIELILVDRSL